MKEGIATPIPAEGQANKTLERNENSDGVITEASDTPKKDKTPETNKSSLYNALYGEIEGDTALRLYGGFLGWIDPLSVFYWIHRLHALKQILIKESSAICFPVWQDCQIVRDIVPSSAWLENGLYVMAGLGMLSSVLFVCKRVKSAHTLLLCSTLMRCAFLLIDFRFEHNANKMTLWSVATFLFLPCKRDVARILLVSYYVWAGLIKVNEQWLSGAALMGRQLWPAFMFPPAAVPTACAYAVVMEVFGSFGLLAATYKWLGFAMLQFFMFHLSSFTVVGYFYPLSMYLLLSILPLVLYQERGHENSLFRAFFSGKAALITYVVFGLFAAANLLPRTFPGEKAISGEGRILALHMYDGNVLCDPTKSVMARDVKSGKVFYFKQFPVFNARGRSLCDPYMIMHQSHLICNYEKLKGPFLSGAMELDVELWARLSTDKEDTLVIKEENVCRRFQLGSTPPPNAAKDVFRYSWWSHNDWIFPELSKKRKLESGATDRDDL